MFQLKCASQRYDWGKIGQQSIVYALQVASKHPDTFHADLPYAELWMGTHPSGPSFLWDRPDIALEAYIQENPACLGNPCLHYFGRKLPFLFKVLSVAKALSIQAHPDKVSLTIVANRQMSYCSLCFKMSNLCNFRLAYDDGVFCLTSWRRAIVN
ncbi:unnamed protein product [Hydatigera taeniaeformis]|uniref:PMI_typeI_cat domain-containing protein n=1 Tax=Hydatigena taeniaeformis TaxID=6205 RepID=A0A0R3WRS4_HYDTA|nr:unnamed protein product [Hydatigera taeniaeformis]